MKKHVLVLIIGITLGFVFAQINRPTETNASTVKFSKAPIKQTKEGFASWYSTRSPGIRKRTANNEIFNDRKMTAAMWGVPFGQMVKVTNLDNGRSIIVRVNDRGPHSRYVRKGRIIDLTKTAFKKLGNTKIGLMNVSVELL